MTQSMRCLEMRSCGQTGLFPAQLIESVSAQVRPGPASSKAGGRKCALWHNKRQATQPPDTGNTCPTKHAAASLAR